LREGSANAVPQNRRYAKMMPPAAADVHIPPPVYAVPADGAIMVVSRSAYVEGALVHASPQAAYVERPVYVERRAYFPFSILPRNW
jgi:hypothetical protein